MSHGKAASGTVMWMPLAGRMECGFCPSSRARTSSAHTPAALTTTEARMSNDSPSSEVTVAPSTRPSGPVVRAVARTWLAATAPWSSTAVRSTVSVSRASSVRASQYRNPATNRSAWRLGMWARAWARVTFSWRRPIRTPPVRS